MTAEQETELKHKSIKTLWEIARREVEVKDQASKLAELEKAFGTIQESTGIATIDEMVAAFVATEDRNYAILTMINDLNRVRAPMIPLLLLLCPQVHATRTRPHAATCRRSRRRRWRTRHCAARWWRRAARAVRGTQAATA